MLTEGQEKPMTESLEQIPLKTIDGQTSSLGAYAGKVRLVVNVASQCGLTPQYEGLEALYRKLHGRGFEILAFPANEFGGQEPGSEAEIKAFCSTKYEVSFPLFAKVVVKGEGQHPLYAQLTREKAEARELPNSTFRAKLAEYGIKPGAPGEVAWNFEKFLLDRHGRVVDRFAPDVPPDAEMLTSAVERELSLV
jgi:glutathione peroxidase